MKRLMWIFAGATFFAALVYSVVSLNRWEWTRALYFGLVVIIAEVGLATGLVLRKLDRLAAERADDERREVRQVLHQTRPNPRRFAWLDPKEVVSRSNVFITMLVGGGVLLSGLAWALDRGQDHDVGRLAGDLTRISYPEDGLLVDEVTVLAQSVPHFDDPDLRALLRRNRS